MLPSDTSPMLARDVLPVVPMDSVTDLTEEIDEVPDVVLTESKVVLAVTFNEASSAKIT